MLSEYKLALTKKECKYFRRGEGECPFGNKCFYRHVSASGEEIDVGPPPRRLRRCNAEGELSLVQRLLIADFYQERNDRSFMLIHGLDQLLAELSEDSEAEYF